jgi:hypothetical protein
MFLYGKKPKLTTDNAEIMLTLAEYFLIPNLKSACVAWLQNVEVTDENCLKLLQVASLFDIELPKCMEFVEGHLDSLFENEKFTDIDTDSVKYIFTERKFSYICMDDKLKFLIRWTKVDPIKRQIIANEFVELLNFNDISEEMLKEIANNPVCSKITEEKVAAETTTEKTNRHEVLVMEKEEENYETSFLCLDLTRNKWFKLEIAIPEGQSPYSHFDILGVQNSESTVYFSQSSYNENNIVFFDLETNTFQTFPVVISDSGETLHSVYKIAMFAEVYVFTQNVTVTKESEFMLGQVGSRRISIQTTNIYIGRAVDNRIETKLLFTLKERVSKICIDNLSCVAFLTDSHKNIIIYDFSNCRMEIVEETTKYNDKLCSAENGFVIFNDARCIYLQRLQGPSLEIKYQKKIMDFIVSGKEYSYIQMYFCKDRWYRYFRRSYEDDYQFEYIPHSEILESEHADDVAWTPLPLPLEASKCGSGILKQMFHVRLPKSKLRCYIECPHCEEMQKAKSKSEEMQKAKSKSRTVYHTRDRDDDSSYYEDSSEEDNYGYYGGEYGYYDDFHYYYDSD